MARKGVDPQYDFTPDKASAVARQQALAFATQVEGVDAAFETTVSEKDRLALLKTVHAGADRRLPGDPPRR